MIELTDLSKTYSTTEVRTLAVNKLSLQIQEGEFVAIMGPSGCGKSTLLNILGMLDRPDSGSYKFNGKEIAKSSVKELGQLRKQNVGFVFQNFNLIEELTVRQNIELPLMYHSMGKVEMKKRVEEVMEKFNISHRANHYPPQLSGGQQQRVAVARALVNRPKLVLADEPTGNLDSKNGNEVLDMLVLLNKSGTTVIMVTHSESDATKSSRIVRMLDGSIVPNKTYAL
jgi:putative ABC transport system ATP-binding protein